MRPHPNIRKTIKWGGAAVTVLLVVVWWWSAMATPTVHFFPGGTYIALSEGSFSFGQKDGLRNANPSSLRQAERDLFRWNGRCWWSSIVGTSCPIWQLVIVVAIPTGFAWCLDAFARRRARGRGNLCPNCNYDRAGIGAGAVCPECGSKGGPA